MTHNVDERPGSEFVVCRWLDAARLDGRSPEALAGAKNKTATSAWLLTPGTSDSSLRPAYRAQSVSVNESMTRPSWSTARRSRWVSNAASSTK